MASKIWKVKIKNSNDKTIASLVRARDIRFSKRLSGTPSVSFKLDIDDPLATDAILSTGVNDVELFRDGTKVFRGRIWGKTKNYDGDNGDVRVDAYGYFALLDKRLAGKDNPRDFSSVDAGTIAWTLINESQAETGGNLGITQGTIQASANRTRSFRYKRISEAIIEFADATSGFDFEITPANAFNVYYPFQGSTKSNIVFKYPGAIQKVEQIDQSGEIINFRVGLGKAFGETEIRTRDSDATSILTYGRREDVANYRDVDNVTTLGNMVTGDIARFKNLVAVYRITINQDSSPYDVSNWGVGDSVAFKVKTDKWTLDKTLRILAFDISIDDEGKETVTFTTGEVGGEGILGGANRPTEVPTIEGEIASAKKRLSIIEFNQPRGDASIIVAPTSDTGDTTSIQSAIDYVNNLGGGTVLLKAGTYTPTSNLSVPSNVIIRGEGVGVTIIDFKGGAFQILFTGTLRTIGGTGVSITEDTTTVTGVGGTTFTNATAGDILLVTGGIIDFYTKIASIESATSLTLVNPWPVPTITNRAFSIFNPNENCSISHLTVTGSSLNTSSQGIIHAKYARNFFMDSVISTKNTTSGGFGFDHIFDSEIRNSTSSYNGNSISSDHGFYVNFAIRTTFYNSSSIGNAANGFFLDSAGSSGESFFSCLASGNGADGFNIEGTAELYSCIAEGNDGDGFDISGNKDVLESCISTDNGANGVNVSSTNNVINNCFISQNDSYGVTIGSATNTVISQTGFSANTSGPISDSGTNTIRSSNSDGVESKKLSAFAATTSAELAGVLSDETGSGAAVFGTNPTLTTPNITIANNTEIKFKNSAGTAKDLIRLDDDNYLRLGQIPYDAAGTASTKENVLIQHGWTYATGSGAATASVTVTLPIAYANAGDYIVMTTVGGAKTTGGVPTTPADYNTAYSNMVSGSTSGQTASQFIAKAILTTGTITSGHYILIHWVAIGTKA